MKEATGVHTATAVIEKFVAQEETHSALAMLSREAHGKIQSLQKEREAARQRLVDARYATSDGVARVASREAASSPTSRRRLGRSGCGRCAAGSAPSDRAASATCSSRRARRSSICTVFETTAKLPPSPRRRAAAEADGAARHRPG